MRYANDMPKRVGAFQTRYPWREIAESGKIGVLVEGEDFDVLTQNPRRAAYQWARANGYRVKTRHVGREVFVQFVGK